MIFLYIHFSELFLIIELNNFMICLYMSISDV